MDEDEKLHAQLFGDLDDSDDDDAAAPPAAPAETDAVSYTHQTLPTTWQAGRSRWAPDQ